MGTSLRKNGAQNQGSFINQARADVVWFAFMRKPGYATEPKRENRNALCGPSKRVTDRRKGSETRGNPDERNRPGGRKKENPTRGWGARRSKPGRNRPAGGVRKNDSEGSVQ